MNEKKVRAIVKINALLKDEKIEKFKIGKTDDLKRRLKEHEKDGYTEIYLIAECNSLEEVNKLETELINFYKNKTTPNCANKHEGGNGRISESEKYYIYVVTK